MPTQTIVIGSAQCGQYYQRLLYDCLRPAVRDVPIRMEPDDRRFEDLSRCHAFHLHSPEDLPFGPRVELHRALADDIRRSGAVLLWTQHNFEPHDKELRAPYGPIYHVWAGNADLVIHHSHWGMTECRRRLPFRPDARHAVVRHGHFGPLMPELPGLDPEECRRDLGLHPHLLCLGVIGHPRSEKRVSMAMQAFVAAGRDDMQLLVLSLADHDRVPHHPRIVAIPHRAIARDAYNRRLRAIDVALLPFAEGMLTTGSVADVIALGVPAIISDWPYLEETLGPVGIRYGSTRRELADCIAALSPADLHASRQAIDAKQHEYSYGEVAKAALPVLQDALGHTI